MFAVGLRTCTAVARSLCVSWAFLLFNINRATIEQGCKPMNLKQIRSISILRLAFENLQVVQDINTENRLVSAGRSVSSVDIEISNRCLSIR